jgi:MFS family permease
VDKQLFRNRQYYQFCAYGFLKNLRFFDPFFMLFLYEIGLSYFQIGLLYSIRQIAVNVLEIPSGIIADAFGRKKSMMFSMSSYIVSFLMFYRVSSMPLLMLAMIFFGIGEAFRSGTHKAMILEYLRLNKQIEFKTRYYGSTRSCSQLGSALSALLAMMIVFYSGDLRSIFLLSIIPYIINLLQLSTYPAELDGKSSKVKWGEFSAHTKKSLIQFKEMLKEPIILHGLLGTSIFTALYKITKDYLQPLIRSLVLTLPVIFIIQEEKRIALFVGIIYSILYLLSSFAAKNAYKLEKRVKYLNEAINIAYFNGVILLGLSGLFLKLDMVIIAVLLFMGIYIIQNIRRPMVVSYLGGIIPAGMMASGLSVESQLQTIIIVIFAPIFGFISDLAGLPEALIITGILFLIIYSMVKLKQ